MIGTIHLELGNLSDQLIDFRLSCGNFIGSVPTELDNFSKLYELNLFKSVEQNCIT